MAKPSARTRTQPPSRAPIVEAPFGTARRSARAGRGAVTLIDVAAAACVAPITASRALNNPAVVSDALRSRIDAAVETLGYVPNRMAGALASARTHAIPVIVPSLSNVVFVEVIAGIQEAIEARGYQMLLGSTDYDLQREAALANTLLGWAPPGVLIAGLRHLPRTTSMLRNADVPVVEFMEYGARCIDMNVGLSHVRAGEAMANHLLERGYRRLGFVGLRLQDDHRARQRYEGMRRTIAATAGASVCLFDYRTAGGQTVGWKAIVEILAEKPAIDALFFANDEMAVGAILRAQRDGIDIPGRVAVAGFNGLPMSALVTPALTTIESPRKQIGLEAATMLLARIDGIASMPRRRDVGFVLRAREST